MKFLIIQSDYFKNNEFKKILEDKGCLSYFIKMDENVLDHIKRLNPAIVFVNAGKSILGGIELISRIRKKFAGLLIVVHAENSLFDNILLKIADKCIFSSKRLKKLELNTMVSEILKQQQKNKEVHNA